MNSATPNKILISIADQRLDLLSIEGNKIASWPISSSLLGTGMEEGSFKTPTGRFRIGEKIGHNSPPWMIFKARVQTGEIAISGGHEDLILTRILWLEGLDLANSNTRDRYIYIHGTNQEELIGTPASHGCIRLRNYDILDLFDRVTTGTLVEILS